MKVAYNIIIQGRVQGVGYRWFTMQVAQRFNVNGFVANLFNGDVEVFVQGDDISVQAFIAELREGPSYAKVTNLVIKDADVNQNLNEFKVKH